MSERDAPTTDLETTNPSVVVSFDPVAAYALGYADGRRLVSGRDEKVLRPIRDRFLAHVEAEHPTATERAYVAGVRDAAADNLPSPPQEPYASPYQHAA